MYEAETDGVRVAVEPEYLEERSSPAEGRYLWAYTVEIENLRQDTVQLVARSWRITDAAGRVEEVSGAGVVGEQPILKPGDLFRYTSAAPLTTPSGFMSGAYQMVTADGQAFEAMIPAFSLDSPYEPARRRPN